MNTTIMIILLLSPLLIGGIIAALNAEGVNNATEKAESWIRNKKTNAGQKTGWFYRYLVNPFLFVLVKFSDWTENFEHQGLKNGVRVASALYFTALTALILFGIIYLMIMIALVVLAVVVGGAVLWFILKVVFQSDTDLSRGFEKGKSFTQKSSKEKSDIFDHVGNRGQNVYSGTSWLDEDLAGRVDEDGNIYSGTSWLTENRIGRISKDGTIYEGSSFLDEKIVGRIGKDGTIYKGTGLFDQKRVGNIDKNGDINKGTSFLDEKHTGRTGK